MDECREKRWKEREQWVKTLSGEKEELTERGPRRGEIHEGSHKRVRLFLVRIRSYVCGGG